jgi:next-to-BRCA1 protein 1
VDSADASAPVWPRQTDVTETIASVVDTVADAAKSFMEDVDEQILKQTMEMSLGDSEKAAAATPPANAPAATADKAESPTSPASSFSAGTVKGYALKPMARFIGDITIPDATIVAPSTDFVKIWLVRNDGPCDWPTFGDGVRLVTAGGDVMCDANLSLFVESIKVGQETHISVTLKSPPTPGRYVSYFRLQAADGVVFGQKLWVDIRVQASPGHIGFTSPAFAVAKQAKAKEASGSESKESNQAPLPVTLATSSATLPFVPPPVQESEIEMEFPGGDFEDISHPTLTPTGSQVSDSDSGNAHGVKDASESVALDEDAQWAIEREEAERDWKVELDALRGMGFHNTRENVKLLKKHTKCSFARFPQLQGKPFSDTLSTILDALLH